MLLSAAGSAYLPLTTYRCPSLVPFPSAGGGAHRPLTTLCPPSLAYPDHSTRKGGWGEGERRGSSSIDQDGAGRNTLGPTGQADFCLRGRVQRGGGGGLRRP